jgi:hypothetical protein
LTIPYDPVLWELTTVEVPDDPSEIAAGATALLANLDEPTDRAERWIKRADAVAAEQWWEFLA